MPTASSGNLQTDLNQLANSKALLASAIDIVRYLERIQRSLETVAVMGADAHKIPADAKRFFVKLGPRITALPAPKLRAYLRKLDEMIRSDLDRIVAIADGAATPDLLEDSSALFGLDEDAVKALITEFERRTRTSVSMRVLMLRRGLKVDVLVIPVAEEILQDRIDQLEEQEQEFSGEIQNEIVSMKDDIDLILANHPCSDTLKAQLEGVRDELQQNLEHIRSGKPMDDLPFPVEIAEGTESGTWPTPVEAEPPPAPEPKVEAPEPPAKAPPTTAPAPIAEEPVERGFWSTLWVYFTTPNRVTWEQAKTWQKGDS